MKVPADYYDDPAARGYDDPETWDKIEDFAITQVIGRVAIDPTAQGSAYEEAFKMIARHDARGEFQFPMPGDGRIVTVSVDYPDHQ